MENRKDRVLNVNNNPYEYQNIEIVEVGGVRMVKHKKTGKVISPKKDDKKKRLYRKKGFQNG